MHVTHASHLGTFGQQHIPRLPVDEGMVSVTTETPDGHKVTDREGEVLRRPAGRGHYHDRAGQPDGGSAAVPGTNPFDVQADANVASGLDVVVREVGMCRRSGDRMKGQPIGRATGAFRVHNTREHETESGDAQEVVQCTLVRDNLHAIWDLWRLWVVCIVADPVEELRVLVFGQVGNLSVTLC